MPDGSSLISSLAGPVAVKGDDIIIVGIEINAGAEYSLDIDRLVGFVENPDRARHSPVIAEYSISQHRADARDGVLHRDFKSIRIGIRVGEEGRKTGRLTLRHPAK